MGDVLSLIINQINHVWNLIVISLSDHVTWHASFRFTWQTLDQQHGPWWHHPFPCYQSSSRTSISSKWWDQTWWSSGNPFKSRVSSSYIMSWWLHSLHSFSSMWVVSIITINRRDVHDLPFWLTSDRHLSLRHQLVISSLKFCSSLSYLTLLSSHSYLTYLLLFSWLHSSFWILFVSLLLFIMSCPVDAYCCSMNFNSTTATISLLTSQQDFPVILIIMTLMICLAL